MSQRPARILELMGFILIALSVTFTDATRPWPGSYAVVPVLGTMLVLAANRQQSFYLYGNFSTDRCQFLLNLFVALAAGGTAQLCRQTAQPRGLLLAS